MNFWGRFSPIPNAKQKKVSDINLDYLKNILGILLIIIDCDNTLCEHEKFDISKDIVNWINKAKNKGLKIIIASNNKKERVEPIAKALEIEYVAKAYKFSVFLLWWKTIRKNEINPKQTLVIGDQILMDIIPGNIIGAYTVLVEPLSSEDAFITKTFSRRLEKFLLNI